MTLALMEQEFRLNTFLNQLLAEDFGLLGGNDLVISPMNKEDWWQICPKFGISAKDHTWRSTISKCLGVAQDEALQESVNTLLVQMSHEAIVKLIDATQSNETDKISDRPGWLSSALAQRKNHLPSWYNYQLGQPFCKLSRESLHEEIEPGKTW